MSNNANLNTAIGLLANPNNSRLNTNFIVKLNAGQRTNYAKLSNVTLKKNFIKRWIRNTTGYKTARGDFVAYDSGFGKKVPDYDWTKPVRVAGPSIMWGKARRKTGGMTVHAVYMLMDQ